MIATVVMIVVVWPEDMLPKKIDNCDMSFEEYCEGKWWFIFNHEYNWTWCYDNISSKVDKEIPIYWWEVW